MCAAIRRAAVRGAHHEQQPGQRQQQARHQRAPAQMLRFAQQHDPDRNGAYDQCRHFGARVADGQHQQQVIAAKAQHTHHQRRQCLARRGQAPPALSCQQAHQHDRCGQRTIGSKPPRRQIDRGIAAHDARHHEHQAPQGTRSQARQNPAQHPNPANARARGRSAGPPQASPAPEGLTSAAPSLPAQAWTDGRAAASRSGTSSALHEVFSKSGEAKSVGAILMRQSHHRPR